VSLFAWRDGGLVRIGSLGTGRFPAQLIAADLNSDGWTDLVVRNAGDGTLSVFFNTGPQSGSDPFGPPLTLPAGAGVSDVTLADVDQDGVRDPLFPNKLSGAVGVLGGLGGGAFPPPAWYRAGTGLYGLDTTGGPATVTSLEATAGVAAGRF